jgi:hypothetical protein
MMIVREVNLLPEHMSLRRMAVHVQAAAELPVKAVNVPDKPNVVEFIVHNPNSTAVPFVLYRGVENIAPPYYFGNAFYSVYLSSIEGAPPIAYWYAGDQLAPTPAKPTDPYALGVLKSGDGKHVVAFLFVAPPNGDLSFYEGGIPDASKLIDMHAYMVDISTGQFCVHYSDAAVQQYEWQTGYSVSDLPPNPFTASTVLMTPLEANYPTNEIFPGQYATEGACPTPSPGKDGTRDSCTKMVKAGLEEIMRGIMCTASGGATEDIRRDLEKLRRLL